ncbi:MAG: maleylpyruvate isomerase N-terminal domain-containing protein, partial [Actinomycetota bacterium]
MSVRQSEIDRALAELDERRLRDPSHLPGWDRLTIACHLRFGAQASERMTTEALAGAPAAFYPKGRSHQRD